MEEMQCTRKERPKSREVVSKRGHWEAEGHEILAGLRAVPRAPVDLSCGLSEAGILLCDWLPFIFLQIFF